MSPADLAAVCGNNRNNDDGFGFGGNSAWWIVILLLFGWGGRGFGNGFGGGYDGQGGGYGYGAPVIVETGKGGCCSPCATQEDVRQAVDQQTLISKLDQQTYGLADSTYALNNAINTGFNGINTAMMQGFHGVDNAVCTLGYNVQSGFNGLSRQIADCCCDTRAAIADVKYQSATNTCAIQNTIQNTTRDVIENANANSRAILDALNANYIRTLEQENNSLRLSASQSAQNAVLMAAMDANKAEILRRTGAECPTPAYVVQPPQPVTFPTNCCGQANYAGGCGSF
jgi:hypothetical protein